jgi:hypothetical protein
MPNTKVITTEDPAGNLHYTNIIIFQGYFDWWMWFHQFHSEIVVNVSLGSGPNPNPCLDQMVRYFDMEFAPCYGGMQSLSAGTLSDDVLSFESKCQCLMVDYRRLLQDDWSGTAKTYAVYDGRNELDAVGVGRVPRSSQKVDVPQISEWANDVKCPGLGTALLNSFGGRYPDWIHPVSGLMYQDTPDYIWWMDRRHSESPFHIYP